MLNFPWTPVGFCRYDEMGIVSLCLTELFGEGVSLAAIAFFAHLILRNS
ncbi:hypothetical protein [Thermopetrobacter sp. TC1]|nr:hypothetical protein [Thermopetrobacter sp. TC1]